MTRDRVPGFCNYSLEISKCSLSCEDSAILRFRDSASGEKESWYTAQTSPRAFDAAGTFVIERAKFVSCVFNRKYAGKLRAYIDGGA